MIAQPATITCLRGDPLQVPFRVIGVDLSASAMTFAVGLYADPNSRLWILELTANIGGEGVRFVRLDQTVEGLPVSVFEIIAAKERMKALPTAGEVGDDLDLFFDLQTSSLAIGDGLANVEATLLRGPLIIKGSVND